MKTFDQISKIYLLIGSLLLIATGISGQVTIGNGEAPHPSAVLELKSENGDKGFLGARVSLIRADSGDPIENPARGLLVYNLTDSPASVEEENKVEADKFYYWSGDRWVAFVGEKIIETIVKESLDTLGIPRSAIFVLDRDDPSVTQVLSDPAQYGINDFFRGKVTGDVVDLPLSVRVNNIGEGLSLSGKSNITFKPGLYSITVSYGFEPINTASILTACTISSYFVDFPVDYDIVGDRARIHSTTSHGIKNKAAHSGIIRYVTYLESDYTWVVSLGLGQSGNCQSTSTWIDPGGFALMSSNTYIFITRLRD